MRSEVLAFTGVAALLTISPGADMALVGRRALGPGPRRDAYLAAVGISCGVVAWAALSAVGVAAVLAVLGVAWLCGYAWVLHRGRAAFRPWARAALQCVTGVVLVGLGARVASR